MSRYVSSSGDEGRALLAAVESGAAVRVGGCAPAKDMKWMGWRVVRYGGRLYAIVTDSTGSPTEAIEQIDDSEFPLYDDTPPHGTKGGNE